MERNKTIGLLIAMALAASFGIVLLFLGCALHFPGNDNVINWWGIFVLVFYLLSPIPLAIARRVSASETLSSESINLLYEICYFVSASIVVAGFGLPTVLARKEVIQGGAAGMIAGANIFVFGTVYSFFVFFTRDEEWEWTNF